jgi:type IV pilus assembly protein PilE
MKAARQSGFTLIELMITVAVVAILASIAYPSYQNYVLSSRRAEAQADMLEMQLGMEKWRANRASYRSDATPSAKGVATTNTPANAGYGGTNSYYTYTITDTTESAYIITATPQGAQTADSNCTPLTLNQSGAQTPSSGCWKGSGS